MRGSDSHGTLTGGGGRSQVAPLWPPVTSRSGMLITEPVNAMLDKHSPPPPVVPHFKLPLLGSGHKNLLCSTCQMWDAEEAALTSNLHFLFPTLLLMCAIVLFIDRLSFSQLWSLSLCLSPHLIASVWVLPQPIHSRYLSLLRRLGHNPNMCEPGKNKQNKTQSFLIIRVCGEPAKAPVQYVCFRWTISKGLLTDTWARQHFPLKQHMRATAPASCHWELPFARTLETSLMVTNRLW